MVARANLPRFIIGQDPEGDEFVAHFGDPMFVARIAETDDDGEPIHPDEDADVLSGLTFGGEGFTICQVVLLEGDPSQLSSAMREAARFVAALRDD